jgi:hypothetical protein
MGTRLIKQQLHQAVQYVNYEGDTCTCGLRQR